jgi:hypothetical protein
MASGRVLDLFDAVEADFRANPDPFVRLQGLRDGSKCTSRSEGKRTPASSLHLQPKTKGFGRCLGEYLKTVVSAKDNSILRSVMR